jgi:hypothetical protein
MYLWSYLLTQVAFFLGIFCFKPLKRHEIVTPDNNRAIFEEELLLIKLLFIISSAAFIVAQLLSYKLVGIPLFMMSRTGAYADTGGLGILGHIIDVLRPATTFMLIYILFKPGNSVLFKIYLTLFGVFLLVSIGLSGSKSLFMSIGFILFIYLILNAAELKTHFFKIGTYERYLLAFGMVFVFLTILIQSNDESAPGGSMAVFLYRLVASGDVYYFSYPDGAIETIDGSKGFLALFGDILSIVRIVPRSEQPGILGLQLFQIYYDADLITGPNARHNVFGYVYYGFYGSILFSFLIGAVLSFVRNKLFFALRGNVLGQIAFMFLYLNLTFIETDPPVAVAGLSNAILIFPLFVILALILYVPFYKMQNQLKPA